MRFAIAAVMLAVATQCADAAIIFDNLSSTTYAPAAGYTISDPSSPVGSYNDHSESFTAGLTANLDQILLPVWHANGSSSFNLFLKDSSSNVLESWSGLIAPNVSGSTPVVVAVSALNPVLQSGQSYTLLATPGNATWDAWEDVSNTLSFGTSGYRVEGTEATVTPEPTSLALAGFAGIGMAAGAWRRRRQQKQAA